MEIILRKKPVEWRVGELLYKNGIHVPPGEHIQATEKPLKGHVSRES